MLGAASALSRIDPRPGWAGDDIALPTYGLRTKVRRVGWATLTKHNAEGF